MRRGASFPPGLYFPFIMADLRMTTAEIEDKGSNILFTLVLSPPVVARLPRRQAQPLLINPYPLVTRFRFPTVSCPPVTSERGQRTEKMRQQIAQFGARRFVLGRREAMRFEAWR